MVLKVSKKYGTSSVMIEITNDELDSIVVDYLKDIYKRLQMSLADHKESLDYIHDYMVVRSIEGVLTYINTLEDTAKFIREVNKSKG